MRGETVGKKRRGPNEGSFLKPNHVGKVMNFSGADGRAEGKKENLYQKG